ncbi:MAG: hypothetical protein ABI844_13460 [Saprospiraceae bacterium]
MEYEGFPIRLPAYARFDGYLNSKLAIHGYIYASGFYLDSKTPFSTCYL